MSNLKFYAWACTGIAVCTALILPEIDNINPFKIPLAIIGSIAGCIGAMIFALDIIMTITDWRMERRFRKQQVERLDVEIVPEDLKRFVDEDLGLVIIIDEAAGKMRILERREDVDETQED